MLVRVRPDGSVEHSEAALPAPAPEPWAGCFAAALRDLRFPAAERPIPEAVYIPFDIERRPAR